MSIILIGVYSCGYLHSQIDTLLCKNVKDIRVTQPLTKNSYGLIWGNNIYLSRFITIYNTKRYDIVVDRDSTASLLFMYDSTSQTQEGVKLDMKLRDVLALSGQQTINYSYYHKHLYIPLKNNWFAVFYSKQFSNYADQGGKVILEFNINARTDEDEYNVPSDTLLNLKASKIIKTCKKQKTRITSIKRN